MHNHQVIRLLADKLGEVAQKLVQIGYASRSMGKPVNPETLNEIAGDIWAALTKCEAVYDDIPYENDKKVNGFMH